MASTVVLIMHMDNVLLFESLARCTAVWVADTPANAVLKNRLTAERGNLSITWFPVHDGESLETAAVRITFSLDDHFNEHVQPRGYQSLMVFGAQYQSSMSKDLAVLDFKNMEPTVFGFVAAK